MKNRFKKRAINTLELEVGCRVDLLQVLVYKYDKAFDLNISWTKLNSTGRFEPGKVLVTSSNKKFDYSMNVLLF